MMLPVTPPRDGEDRGQEATIASNVRPLHSSSSTHVTFPDIKDSDSGFELESYGSNTENTDVATDADADGETDIDSDDADDSDFSVDIPSDGDRPEDWITGAYSTLKSLVTGAKGAASKRVVRFIKKQSGPFAELFVPVPSQELT